MLDNILLSSREVMCFETRSRYFVEVEWGGARGSCWLRNKGNYTPTNKSALWKLNWKQIQKGSESSNQLFDGWSCLIHAGKVPPESRIFLLFFKHFPVFLLLSASYTHNNVVQTSLVHADARLRQHDHLRFPQRPFSFEAPVACGLIDWRPPQMTIVLRRLQTRDSEHKLILLLPFAWRDLAPCCHQKACSPDNFIHVLYTQSMRRLDYWVLIQTLDLIRSPDSDNTDSDNQKK